MLAISDVFIHAMLFVKVQPSYRIEHLLHDRYIKNKPIKATYKEVTISLVPDAYLEFVYTGNAGKEETIPILLELDRGTEDQKFFRKRVRAYAVFLRSRVFETPFGVQNITVAFATTKDHNRIKQMRDWTRKELAQTNEPKWLYDLFLFTALPENMDAIEPVQLFLDPVWNVPLDYENPVSLIG